MDQSQWEEKWCKKYPNVDSSISNVWIDFRILVKKHFYKYYVTDFERNVMYWVTYFSCSTFYILSVLTTVAIFQKLVHYNVDILMILFIYLGANFLLSKGCQLSQRVKPNLSFSWSSSMLLLLSADVTDSATTAVT